MPPSTPLRNLWKYFVWIVPLLPGAGPVWAATLAVTSAADSASGSLRATIASANPGDTVAFAASLAGQTIHLTSGELAIGKNLTIDGSTLPIGAKPVAIDGGGSFRVLEITGGNVIVDSLTLTNGFGSGSLIGGGILVDAGATMTVNGSTICGCAANNGSAGGGIYNYGSLQLNNSTISNCVSSGNTGGGIYDNGTAAVLNNCTLTGNSAQYGGGLDSSASTVVLTNTIVAGNTATYSPDISGSYSGTNNLIAGNPKLAPLGNYGGPTQTMPPLFGSPAIDAGSDSVLSFLTTDQRGYARRSGGHVDIGAVEAHFAPANNPPVLKNATRSSSEFQFAFTNASSVDFTALTSTNFALPLASWTALGNAVEISSGHYQFTNTSATNQAQFYRVVSP